MSPTEEGETIPDMELEQAMKLIQRGGRVVVELWATWCFPCELLKKVLTEISKSGDFPEISFVMVNSDSNPSSYSEFGIRALPALVGFRNGTLQQKLIGFFREDRIREFLSNI